MQAVLSLLLAGKGKSTGAKAPWTAVRIAKTAGTVVAVGGGAAALLYGYVKLSAQPATAPSPTRKFVGDEVGAWLETDAALREACDRMLLFAGFNRPAFVQLVAACAETARFMYALHSGALAYSATTPRQLSHYTAAIERALTEFQRKVPHSARADYMEVDNDFDTAITDLRSNVRLQSQVVMEHDAVARGAALAVLKY